MLEGVVSSVLNQVLSAYVENFNPKQLNVGIWGGDIKLKNLKLKKGALDKFRLPIDVIDGSIGSLILTVPWTALGSRPVKAVIEEIYLLAVPASENKFDPQEDQKRKQATKMEKLKNSELLLSSVPAEQNEASTNEEVNKNESFVAAMTNKILDNLQLRIKNVHIRYEDRLSVPRHPFSVGFTLAELSAVSTDESWTESFIVGPKSGVHKLTNLNSLAIYFNTDSTSLANLDNQEDFHIKFTELIASSSSQAEQQVETNLPDHQYILKPVSGQGKLIMRKQPTKQLAKIDLELAFSELAFLIDADQYRDALSCLDLFHFYTRHRDFLRFRPSEEVFAQNKARALWKFALEATSHAMHEKAYKWSWECFRQRRDDRKSYIKLYKLAQQGTLSPPDQAELDELDQRLSYQDMRFYRSLARSEMRKERITAKQQEASTSAPAKTGWLEWVWGGNAASSAEPESVQHTDGVLSEEEKKQLYDAIEWDEREAVSSAIDLPRDAIQFNLNTQLKTGSFTLRSGQESSDAAVKASGVTAHDIISLVFDGFSAGAVQRTDNSEFTLSLAGFRVYDGTVKGTKHPQIVRVKENQFDSLNHQTSDPSESSTAIISPDSTPLDNYIPFLHLQFEHNPMDGRANNAISLKMRHLEIVYHSGYVEDVVKFFQPPASQLESVGALINVASETLEGIRQDTRAGLEFALQTHKTVDIKVDMNAPIIIIPEDVTTLDCQHIMLDAGRISVSSNLAAEEGFQVIKAKQNQHYTEQDYLQLESMMYDQFHVELNDIQLLLGRSFDQCISALDVHEGYEEVHLLERISMHFDVSNCIVDNAPNLTRFKVQGDLPQLRVNFSDRKYKIVMSMIDVAIPHFESDTEVTPFQELQSGGDKQVGEVNDSTTGNKRKSNFGVSSFFLDDSGSSYELSDDEKSKQLLHGNDATLTEEDTFFEAPDLSHDGKSINSRQKKFELQFTVGKLSVSISKSTGNGGEEQKLINSVLEGFHFGFSLRNFDHATEITLSSMYIEDCLMQSSGYACSAFDKLVTSESLILDKGSGEKNDLVKLNYSQVQIDHPGFMTVYEGISKTVDAELSTINVAVTRTTILEVFDWIMNTFTDSRPIPPAARAPQIAQKQTSERPTSSIDSSSPDASAGKIRVKVKLRMIAFLLNDDGLRLATVSLSSADLSVLLKGPTMRVNARLGNLTVQDDTVESKNSNFRQLVQIEGDSLADLQYETFSALSSTYPGHDSMIYLRSGSIQVTVVDEIIHRILIFFSKFARMKAVMDAASQAARQQANEFTQTTTKMHYDILIRTPIIIFPFRKNSSDSLIAHLGEISASNSFAGGEDKMVVKTEAGLHNIRLTSEFYCESEVHTLQLLGDVNVDVVMASFNQVDRSDSFPQGPDTDIVARMSDVKINLTKPQYTAIMTLASSVPKIFDLSELNSDPASHQSSFPGHLGSNALETSSLPGPTADLRPEVTSVSRTKDGLVVHLWTTQEVAFTVTNVTLELFDAGAAPVEALRSKGLAKFSLNGIRVHWKTQSDGSMAAELSLKALRAIDTRTSKATKFREIIPVADHDGDQLVLSYNQAGPEANVILELDSPNVILSLDYLYSISAFFIESTPKSKSALAESGTRSVPQKQAQHSSPGDLPEFCLYYRVNITQPRLTILSDLEKSDSDAVHLIIEKIVVTQQEVLTLTISNMGMSLASMADRQSGVSFLDGCTVTLAVDQRRREGRQQNRIQVQTTPLVLRSSYRDFLVIYSVYSRALDYSQVQVESDLKPPREDQNTIAPTSHASAGESTETTTETPIVGEELSVQVDKLQIIIIGDLYELPLLDLHTRPFTLGASNWTTQPSLDTSIELAINYFNLTNSHWEPLMESWPMNFEIASRGSPVHNTLTLESQRRLELNLTAAFVDILMTSLDIWGREGESVLYKKRGMTAPYLVKNLTGYPLKVWADLEDGSPGIKDYIIDDGKSMPWRFEDWKLMRENVYSSSQHTLSLVLQDAGWHSISGISVVREGDQVYPLSPAMDGVTHRLLCHVQIQENVKVVTFRSTFQVQNNTLLPIEMCVCNDLGIQLREPYKLVPGGSCPVPIEAAYHKKIKIRPDPGFQFDWCEEAFKWRELVERPVRTIVCNSMKHQEPAHHFIATTVYDKDDEIVQYYPKITLRLYAPLEIENLLPYDIKYYVYVKELQKTYSAFLRKGGVFPVHIVDPMDLLLLGVEFQEGDVALQSTGPTKSHYAVVNTDNPEDVPIEYHLQVQDQADGSTLNLRLHYMRYPLSGGAFKIQIYSPYVVLNKTGLDFEVRSKPFIGSAKSIAGQNLCSNANRRKEPRPVLFSHTSDDTRNKAILRVGDSNWSKPFNVDVVGANQQVAMQTSTKTSEYRVGLAVTEGLGNYKLTKVVTIYPRFIIKNEATVSIALKEYVWDQPSVLKPGKRALLSLFMNAEDPQLVVSLNSHAKGGWSKPFRIQDVGKIYVRTLDLRGVETLVHVEILLQGPSTFIKLTVNAEQWPFLIRNKSNSTVYFGQTIAGNANQKNHGTVHLYQSPPDSVTPYAWDEPRDGPESLIRLVLLPNVEHASSSSSKVASPVLRDVHVLEVGQLEPLRTYKRGYKLALDVVVEGQAQVLVISDYNEATNVWKLAKRNDSTAQLQRSDTYSTIGDGGFEAATITPVIAVTVSIILEGIGISIIDSRLRELIYASFQGISVTYQESQVDREYGVIIRWIQLDNQLDAALFPVCFGPCDLPIESKATEIRPNLQIQANVVKDDKHGVVYIKYATVLLQKMSLEMDEYFVIALMGFSKFSGSSQHESANQLFTEPEGIPEPDSEGGGLDLYFELLHLQPFVIVISFERQDSVDVTERTFDSRNPLYFLLNAVTMAIGSISGAPLTLNQLKIESARMSQGQLITRLAQHYRTQGLSQLYRVLASADFLGNPAGLFNNVSSGVQDLFYEPFNGVVLHGSGLGAGIAKGAASLVRKSAFGVTDSVSKITGSVSKGLSAAALDSSWARERQRRQFRDRNKINGFVTGANAFLDSLSSGIQGVALKPYQGAGSEGALGFFKGIGKGLVGVVAKPAVGTFDFLSNVSGGLRNATTVFDPARGGRARLPRHIPSDGILKPYDPREAQGHEWLKSVDNGKFFSCKYVAHVELPNDEDSVCILATDRIMKIGINKLATIWHLHLSELKSIDLVSEGIQLNVKNDHHRPGPFVALTDESMRLAFAQYLSRVVKEFNDKKKRAVGAGVH